MAVLETERLELRIPQERDLDAYVDIHEDPQVLQYVNTLGVSAGRAAGWRSIAMLIGHWHLRGYGHWTVVERASGDVVGRVGLWYPEGWPGVELGWIIRRSRWNEGFATEAARAAIDFAFGPANLTHLISMIREDNARSRRVAEKLGLSVERTLPLKDGDTQVYGIRRATQPTSDLIARSMRPGIAYLQGIRSAGK